MSRNDTYPTHVQEHPVSITFENTPFRRNQTQGHKTLFRKAYALVPGTASTNATAHQPAGWTKTRAWVIAGPAKGFDDTFSHHSVEVLPGGWSSSPEVESGVEAVLFLTKGTLLLTLDDEKHHLEEGGYAYLAPGTDWTIHNTSGEASRFQWVRKAYAPWQGHDADSFVARERDVPPSVQPGTGGIRSTKHFVDPNNLAHDMLVDIVTIQPNGSIPFTETHAMERGIFVLSGSALYRLNDDWVQVDAGDSLRLHSFCPQACYVSGPEEFRSLQFKGINRQCRLT